MLVLSRDVEEWIDITTPQWVRIGILLMRAHGGKARIGIAADEDVVIDRREVTKAKRADAEKAEKEAENAV